MIDSIWRWIGYSARHLNNGCCPWPYFWQRQNPKMNTYTIFRKLPRGPQMAQCLEIVPVMQPQVGDAIPDGDCFYLHRLQHFFVFQETW